MSNTPITVAYADPPYIGYAKYYRTHPDYGGEVDHAALLAQLEADYPAGWALSCYSNSLHTLLPLCPPDTRIAAWVKPWCSWKPSHRVAYAWEPVLWRGGRPKVRGEWTVRDWVAVNASTRQSLVGVKPQAFCFWLFALLGLRPGDTLVDLFPGSGAVTRAWVTYQQQAWATQVTEGPSLPLWVPGENA